MGIIKKLFSTDKSAAARSEVLTNDVLEVIADSPLSGSVKARCRQLTHSDDIALILEAYESETDTTVVDAAEQRLRDVLRQKKGDDFFEVLTTASLNLDTLKDLSIHAKSGELRVALTEKLPDNLSLLEVLHRSKDDEVKITAITKLTDVEALRRLQKEYKGKQKKIFRTIKSRLASIRQWESQASELHLSIEKMAKRLAENTVTASQVAKLNELYQNLKGGLSQTQQADYEPTIELANAYLDEAEQIKASRLSLFEMLDELSEQLQSGRFDGEKADFQQRVKDVNTLWSELPDWENAEAKSMNQRFQQSLHRIDDQATHFFDLQKAVTEHNKLLSKARQLLQGKTFFTEEKVTELMVRWGNLVKSDDAEKQAQHDESFQALLEQLRTKAKQNTAEREKNDRQFPDDLVALDTAIGNADWQKAQSIHEALQQLLRSPAGVTKTVRDAHKGFLSYLTQRLEASGEVTPNTEGLDEQTEPKPTVNAQPIEADTDRSSADNRIDKNIDNSTDTTTNQTITAEENNSETTEIMAQHGVDDHSSDEINDTETAVANSETVVADVVEKADSNNAVAENNSEPAQAEPTTEKSEKPIPLITQYETIIHQMREVLDMPDFALSHCDVFADCEQRLATLETFQGEEKEIIVAELAQLRQRFRCAQHQLLAESRHSQLALMKQQDLLCIQLESESRNAERLQQIVTSWEKINPPLSDGQSAMQQRFESILSQQRGEQPQATDSDSVTVAQQICQAIEILANDSSMDAEIALADSYDWAVRWLSLPKSQLNEAHSEHTLLAWRARYQTAMQDIEARFS